VTDSRGSVLEEWECFGVEPPHLPQSHSLDMRKHMRKFRGTRMTSLQGADAVTSIVNQHVAEKVTRQIFAVTALRIRQRYSTSHAGGIIRSTAADSLSCNNFQRVTR